MNEKQKHKEKTQSKLATMAREHRPSPSRRLFGTPTVPYALPFLVQGSCELSEDYFLTDQVIINPASDLVRPFTRADGRVEALVLAGRNLAYLQRDSTATSGWTYTILSGNSTNGVPNGITDRAVGTDSSGNVTGICVSQSKNTPMTTSYFSTIPPALGMRPREIYCQGSLASSTFRLIPPAICTLS